jgi:hypothetical protein
VLGIDRFLGVGLLKRARVLGVRLLKRVGVIEENGVIEEKTGYSSNS